VKSGEFVAELPGGDTLVKGLLREYRQKERDSMSKAGWEEESKERARV
jgi:hypothetical protein